MVQVLSTKERLPASGAWSAPREGGALFGRKDLNDPHTPVWGIEGLLTIEQICRVFSDA